MGPSAKEVGLWGVSVKAEDCSQSTATTTTTTTATTYYRHYYRYYHGYCYYVGIMDV